MNTKDCYQAEEEVKKIEENREGRIEEEYNGRRKERENCGIYLQ